MPTNLLAIITNTFTETLRQPIYAVVIAATIILLVFSPSLAMFTLDDDNQLLEDVCISTLMVAGLFLAVFSASTVVSEEIENKTALTVISKTVGRGRFIIAKFLGLTAAVILAQYILGIVVLMVVRHGVMQAAWNESDQVVIWSGSIAAIATLIVSVGGNYFYSWRFSSSAVLFTTIALTILIPVLIFIDPHGKFDPEKIHITTRLIGPMLLTLAAVIILTAIAVAAATRFNLVMTLIVCSLVFVLGAMLQYWLWPAATTTSGIKSYLAWLGLTVIPNFNVFVATNAIYDEKAIPFSYVAQTALYSLYYTTAVLMIAIALFRRREIG